MFTGRRLKCGGLLIISSLLLFTAYFTSVDNKRNDYVKILVENHGKLREFEPAEEVRTTQKALDDRLLDVHVVEEHHEVLPVWFDAVRKGIIPATNNTLVHIDGHGDMVSPDVSKHYPLWRLPSNTEEQQSMVQKNDAFILEAVGSGVFNRVIWVFPRWADTTEDENHEYIIFMGIGLALVKHSGGPFHSTYLTFCLCEYNSSDAHKENKCFVMSREWKGEWLVELPNCEVKRRFVFEIMREDDALTKFETQKNLFQKDENVLLDVDEDFYGCVYACTPLLDAGWTMTGLKDVDALVSQIVCVKTSKQEHEANKIFNNILENFKLAENCDDNTFDTLKIRKCKMKFSANQEVNSLVSLLNPYLCKDVKPAKVKKIISILLKIFGRLTQKQLRALQYVGFCLSTSPKTYYKEEIVFMICYGVNSPNQSSVDVYNPNSYDIRERTRLLKTLLYSLKDYRPKLTTLCRSVRDGYTPREHFHVIEKSVIASIESAFGNISLHYDNDLLGGEEGWPNRHKLP